MKRILLSVVGVAFAGPLFAALKLGVPFADGMVLQREMKVPVWGTADAGAEVSVSFAGQSVRTTAGTNGVWKVAGIDNFVGSRPRQGKRTSLPVVRGSRLVVSSPEVPEPVKLRYLHSHPWTGRLYSDVDLPMGAFHVGD